MAWTGLPLTTAGRTALSNAQIGGTLNIKSIEIGDGAPPGNFPGMTALVNKLFSIDDLHIEVVDGVCYVTGDFPERPGGYYFRELGVVVTTDSGDKLYAYDNCGNDAQHIEFGTGHEDTQKRLRLALAISDVANITVSNPNVLYVTSIEHARDLKDKVNMSDVVDDLSTIDLGNIIADYTGMVTSAKAGALLAKEINHHSIKIGLAQTAGNTAQDNLKTHLLATNPHGVNKHNVGLGNVRNEDFINRIVDSLDSDDPKKMLSAKQGKVLREADKAYSVYVNINSDALYSYSVTAMRSGDIVHVYGYIDPKNSGMFYVGLGDSANGKATKVVGQCKFPCLINDSSVKVGDVTLSASQTYSNAAIPTIAGQEVVFNFFFVSE